VAAKSGLIMPYICFRSIFINFTDNIALKSV
jgi:hypothetical protein